MRSTTTGPPTTGRRVHGLLAMAVFILVATTGLLAVPAGATTDGGTHPRQAGVLACRQYNDRTNAYSPDGGGYWYPSDMNHTVPSGSTCRDIQIWVHTSEGCDFFRVRFIGQYATNWIPACWQQGFVILATGVRDGAVYRVESISGPRNFTVMD